MLLKRLVSYILCLLVIACFAPASAEESTAAADFVLAGFDGENTYRTWNTNLFFQRMEEKTGVKFSFLQYESAEKWSQAKAAMTAGDETLPDVLFKASLTSLETETLLNKGVLLDLKPLLEANCPNLVKLLNEHPEYWAQITDDSGRIGALPYISSAPVQNALWINKTWLNELKLSAPTDIASLEAVLTAFKTRDPNKNGKADEIPLAFLGPFDLKFLAHGFGLCANDYNMYAEDGTAKFMPLSENFRPFIEWCRKMYADGLFDKNGFSTSDTIRSVTDSNAAKVYGVIITTAVTNILPSEWATEYEILMPLTYNGQTVYRAFTDKLFRGTFALTTKCQNPEKALQWVDLLYSEEGSKLESVGLENVDYLVDGDGTWRLSETTSGNSYFTSGALITSGVTPPGASADDFQTRYTDSAIADLSRQMIALNKAVSRPFPNYDLTAEEIDIVTPLQNDIGYTVDMQIARWVLGEEEISDESFDAFEQTLKDKGLDRFIAFWQGILDK